MLEVLKELTPDAQLVLAIFLGLCVFLLVIGIITLIFTILLSSTAKQNFLHSIKAFLPNRRLDSIPAKRLSTSRKAPTQKQTTPSK